jgi:hypothetical protein
MFRLLKKGALLRVSINSKMMDKVFNESPDARAVVGKDGWLYFDNCNSLLDATGKAEISDDLVARGVEAFAQNWQKMRAKNIDYLLVIAADKSTVYPEFLPSTIKPSEPHRIDKFLSALTKKYPDFPVLDLRPTLLKAKEKEIIYHKTDTHWNRRGAHYAYVEIAKKLNLKPHLRADYINKEDAFFRGDISDIMGVETENLDYDLTEKFQLTSQVAEISAQEKEKFHKNHSKLQNQITRNYLPSYSFADSKLRSNISCNTIVFEWDGHRRAAGPNKDQEKKISYIFRKVDLAGNHFTTYTAS